MYPLILLLVLLAVALTNYFRKMVPFYALSSKLPGPYAFPVIGNAWKFINKSPKEMMEDIVAITRNYPSPLRFWMGPKLVFAISDAENTKIVLSSNAMNSKSVAYKFLEPLLGNGLITGRGATYREHKKLIQPHLNNDFINGTLNLFLKFKEDFLKDLEDLEGKGAFNVESITQKYVADVLAIKIFGYDTETRMGKNTELLDVAKRFYEIMAYRSSKPWLQLEQLFRFSKLHKVQEQVVKCMNEIVFSAINQAKSRIESGEVKEDSPLIDKFLKAMKENPGVMTEEELGHHLKTLFFASEDTTVTVSSFLLVCLGLNEKHQEVILDELEAVETSSLDYLSGLPHLTKCMKEVLRLFPVGPILVRETSDYFRLGKFVLPPKCTVLINIWGLHHDPKQWEYPDDFYPEHFSSDALLKRRQGSYMPFSMGPRACVGKALAYPWLKLITATVIKKFVIRTEEDLKSLDLQVDVAIRATNGYNISLKRRN